MKKLFFTSILFLVCVSVWSQELSINDLKFIDSLMLKNYKNDGPGAVLLIAKEGKPIFKKAYGLANIEFNIPNKIDYLFRIGSMSKQFTAVCVLQLAQNGKLDLQDNINKYLPDYDTHGRVITIEQLLNHTSGIPSYTEKNNFISVEREDYSLEEIKHFFMNDSLLFEPGTDWSYSNSSYVLAGLIVEKISGISLNEYLKINIFAPLNMSDTYIGNHKNIFKNCVSGYDSAGKDNYLPAEYVNWCWAYAAGSIISNVEDLLKWDNALYTETILKSEWLEKAWKANVLPSGQTTNYGLGWSANNYNGLQIIAHGGGINGFLSDGIRIPSQKLFIAILSNNTSIAPSNISSSIALRISNKSLINIISSTTVNSLQDFTGVYEIYRLGGRLVKNMSNDNYYRYITIQGDTLFSQINKGTKAPLENVGKDLFATKSKRAFYKFHRNENGIITSLEVYNEPIQYGPNGVEKKVEIPLQKEL